MQVKRAKPKIKIFIYHFESQNEKFQKPKHNSKIIKKKERNEIEMFRKTKVIFSTKNDMLKQLNT